MKKSCTTTLLLAISLAAATLSSAAEILFANTDDIEGGKAPLPAAGIVSTGQPNAATLRIVANAGYVAVLDLRGGDEDRGFDEKSEVEALGMSYKSLPIADKAAINYSNAAELDRLMLEVDGPILLHCGSGNRVGALLALRERLHGKSAEEALQAGAAAGLTSLEPIVRERLAEGPP